MEKNQNNLKVFLIKLISISLAIIIIINVLFNLLTSNIKYFDTLVSFQELENRREYGERLRNDLNDLLKKDYIIKEEDRILLYKLYKKLKSEFESVK